MKSAVIRQAVLADLDDVAAVFDQYRQFQGKASDLNACRAFLRERFDHGESIIFLEFLDEQPVGMAQLYPSYSSTALARVFILNDLFVSEAGRRAGVATALLKAVEQYAWTFGACRVSLNLAQPNVSAQDRYHATGWTKDDEFFMFHRFPPKAYTKNLSATAESLLTEFAANQQSVQRNHQHVADACAADWNAVHAAVGSFADEHSPL